MTIEEIVHGESKNVEFKVTLPKDSEKYTKTIVAFANTQGGKLIFGVDELPLEAIREMIINAHCHRNLTDDSCVQVAVYDDRLEVTSPGGLYNGLIFEELMNGHSKIRNRAIAGVFNKMGFVESWGTGVKRIIGAAKSCGLPTPKFQVFDDMFRVDLFRSTFSIEVQKSNEEASEKNQESIGEESGKHRRRIGKASEKNQKSIGEESGKHRRRIGKASEKNQKNIGEPSE